MNDENKNEITKEEEYLTGWKKAQADLDNFRKDEARRIEDVLKFGNERILLEMIEVFDGLETALQHAPPHTDEKWLKGMQQAIDRFRSTLEKHEVKKIRTVGKPFDPLHHEAIQMEDTGADSQTVIEEYRPGYTMHGKVIRPARVKVSN